MEYRELLADGIRVFNFHPDEKFTSCEQILQVARKNMRGASYECGASLFASSLSRYCDQCSNMEMPNNRISEPCKVESKK